MEPIFNEQTGYYEVQMFGQIHEFEIRYDAVEFVHSCMNDYFSDDYIQAD